MKNSSLSDIETRCLSGIGATVDEALALDAACSTDELCDAADRVRIALHGNRVDTCSIANARSGRCTEDCKWCAQSRHFSTGIAEYDIIPREDMLRAVRLNDEHGVHRFSLVTSGRRVSRRDIDRFCEYYKEAAATSGLCLCASMGLLDRESLQALKDAGVSRYHCNLESSSEYFPQLCSTHTHADKLRTIAMAREVGMEVCSGGIIGMGETMRDRLLMVQEASQAGAVSIPVNILHPIPGTPLDHLPLINEEEVIRSMALMRLIAPKCVMRLAGGRARLSKASMRRIMRGGMNGAIVGDLLTTIGNTLDEDRQLFHDTGFEM